MHHANQQTKIPSPLILCALLFTLGHELAKADDLEDWIVQQEKAAWARITSNASQESMGSIVASPSRHDPDYFFHWVRDAALVTDLLQRHPSWDGFLWDHAAFSRNLQTSDALTGLGEPKFYVDGTPFAGPWGRPQNDGPALRALALTRWAKGLIARGHEESVRKYLYDSKFPTGSLIKSDLEYVSQHWSEPCFDLWEEVKGHHFYTRVLQHRALIEGADLATRLGDFYAADWYLLQADSISQKLQSHLSSSGIIQTSVGRIEGLNQLEKTDRSSGIDSSILLAALHAGGTHPLYSIASPELRKTVDHMEKAFQEIYRINQDKDLGTAIGRYPEDTYYGGHPWFLTTLAFAEYYYRLGDIKKGDSYLRRVRKHVGEGYSMSEQFNRDNGYMLSAEHLTWSYVALLSATEARKQAQSLR